jgi:hypothetical protein
VVGTVDGRLALWRVGDAVTRISGVPDTPVDDANPPTAPVLTADGILLGVSGGTGSTVLREQDGRWSADPGPPGPVRAVAVAGTAEYAVAPDDTGLDRLWRRAT